MEKIDSKKTDAFITEGDYDHQSKRSTKRAVKSGKGFISKTVSAIFHAVITTCLATSKDCSISFGRFLSNGVDILTGSVLAISNFFASSFHSSTESLLTTGSAYFASIGRFFCGAFGAMIKGALAICKSNALAEFLRPVTNNVCYAIGMILYLGVHIIRNILRSLFVSTIYAYFAIITVFLFVWIVTLPEDKATQLRANFNAGILGLFELIFQVFISLLFIAMMVVPYAQGGMQQVKRQGREVRDFFQEVRDIFRD